MNFLVKTMAVLENKISNFLCLSEKYENREYAI
jgi:hypothetical protein